MKNKTIIYIYNSFKDPLFQNLMYKYILSLTKKGFSFYLITFEQPEYEISRNEYSKIKEELKKQGIHWEAFQHSTGKFLLFKKLFDLLSVAFTIFKWSLVGDAKNIFAFANVAASHSVIYSVLLRLNLFVYSYEPHAEFQVELGLWKKTSMKFKILNYFEQKAAKKAKLIFTGTKHGVELVKSISPNTPVYRLPTSVDENDFYYRKEEAVQWRLDQGIANRKTVLYIGKFGDLYYEPNTLIDFYETLYQLDKSYYFIIVTSFDLQTIKKLILASSIPEDCFYLDQKISYEKVKILISASDLGMSIVPPLENQKYRSPTKVAEYLLCGLPYLTCKGVSEDDEIATLYNVGIVINDMSADYALITHEAINNWCSERDNIREKCREVGKLYRGKKNVDIAFEKYLIPLLQ